MDELLINSFGNVTARNLNVKNEILKTNDVSQNFGFVLSEQDAVMLEKAGREAISESERIEFGDSVTVKLINRFMNSSYISQTDYADTIASLIEIFYIAKDECRDVLSDEEVIDIMFEFFEHESGGSIELLQNRDMDYLCKKVSYAAAKIIDPEYYEMINKEETE